MFGTLKRLACSSLIAIVVTFVFVGEASATWSIVGVDPATGEVGVAVASCVPAEVGRVAVVVPGVGAAASQAQLNPSSGPVLVRGLEAGVPPAEIIDELTAPDFDPYADVRQFGVVALGAGGAGHSGSGNDPVSLDRRNAAGTASAQGNILVGEAVVEESMRVFDDTEGPLADRLLAALAAGSEAGGDSRCGSQTALTATLVVAQPGDPVWEFTDAPFAGDITDGRPVPSTFVSVVNRRFGANPVDSLVDAFRSAEPVDGTVRVRKVQFGGEIMAPAFLATVIATLVAAAVGVIAAVVILLRRRRRTSAAADVG